MGKLALLRNGGWELAITDLFPGITSRSAKEAFSNQGFCFTPRGDGTWTGLEKQSKLSVRILKELFRTCWVKNNTQKPALFRCYCSFPIKNKIQKQKPRDRNQETISPAC